MRRIATLLALGLCLLAASPVGAASAGWLHNQDIGFWLPRPSGWTASPPQAGSDLAAQLVDNGRNALVEVYAQRMKPGQSMTAPALADAWEQRMSGRAPYLKQRLLSRDISLDGAAAIYREYRGEHQGVVLDAALAYCVHQGKALVLVGVWPERMAATMSRTVKESVTGLRFSPPDAKPAATAAAPPAGTSAAAEGGRSPAVQGTVHFRDEMDRLDNWGGTATGRRASGGKVRFHSGNHTTFLLKQQVPLENVVVMWRGRAYGNGFHGHLGPYHFNIGGWGNSGSGAAGPNAPFKKLSFGPAYKKGVWQIWRVERLGDDWAAFVDGKQIFRRSIPGRVDPPMGTLHFTSYHSDLDIDWIVVYSPGGGAAAKVAAPPPAPKAKPAAGRAAKLLAMGREHFDHGEYAASARAFSAALAEKDAAPAQRAEALAYQGLIDLALGRGPEVAKSWFTKARAADPGYALDAGRHSRQVLLLYRQAR